MFEFFELLLVGSAIGFTSTLIAAKTVTSSSESSKKPEERSLDSNERRRVEGLKELVDKGNDILASTNTIQVQVSRIHKGYHYSFHYQHRMNSFIDFVYDENSESIVDLSVSVLPKDHKEVKAVLEKLKKKVIELHTGKSPVVDSISTVDEVKQKYNELSLRLQSLYAESTLSENVLQELKEKIQPMLSDVMHHYEELSHDNKESFTSKTLDIFYSLEKKLKTYETSLEKQQKDTLESYFMEADKQAKLLSEEN